GLSASFLGEALRVAPELSAVFLSGGPLAEAARQALGDRAEVIEGDVLECEVPGGFDLVLLEHVVHRYDPAQNALILRRAREAATDGGRLLLLDFFLDEDPRQRTLDALHAAEYLVIDGTTVYPAREVRAWMTAAGWEPVQTLDLPGSPRVIVAEAR
ncbi:MAG: polyketide biosynthesis methyltransferase, partial [Nonomuraea sp.]|nr:polyketide biosynthesis methyltransferase [Nonomuraea sp.]